MDEILHQKDPSVGAVWVKKVRQIRGQTGCDLQIFGGLACLSEESEICNSVPS